MSLARTLLILQQNCQKTQLYDTFTFFLRLPLSRVALRSSSAATFSAALADLRASPSTAHRLAVLSAPKDRTTQGPVPIPMWHDNCDEIWKADSTRRASR